MRGCGSFDRVYSICVIPGDGIGPEVTAQAVRVLEATGLNLEFSTAEAGWTTFKKTGKSVPDETLGKARAADAVLAGAFTSPSKQVAGFFSAIRFLRRELNLFANLRPAVSRPLPGCRENVDLLIVRENTEGLYVAQERRYGDVAVADAVVTKAACERIAEVACEEALKRRSQLAIIHKANVLPLTTGLFLETVQEVARSHKNLTVSSLIVDAAATHLVRSPEQFDVLVTTNLFGDILSDLTAGLVGGLGLAPSANIGKQHALFEPVHGSAPGITGKGAANPAAAILSAAMLCDHLGETETAKRIDRAVNKVLERGPRPPDLGGSAGTAAFGDAVIASLASGD